MNPIKPVAFCVALLAATPAISQEVVKLKYASPAPPQSLVTLWGVGPVLEQMVKASDGTLEIQNFLGAVLGNFNQVIDRTAAGINEMAWGILGPYSDQFPQTDVASVPFTGEQGYAGSVALQTLFDRGLIKDDWGKFKVLTLFTFPPTVFHTNSKPIKTLEDFRGSKIGVSVRNAAELVEVVGAASVTMQPSEMYQAGQRGVVDGLAMAWPAFYPFKLHEVTKYHFDGPFGGTPSFVIMNKTAYEKLPAKAKAAIDGKSGLSFASHMGRTTDKMHLEGREAVTKMAGHTFFTLDAAGKAQWKQRAQPLIDKWIKATPNGAAVLAAYEAEYDKAFKESK
jgi:TRAP-type C4-dicarboxylate transport system substrate-binding protein